MREAALFFISKSSGFDFQEERGKCHNFFTFSEIIL